MDDPSIERPKRQLSAREVSVLRLIAWGHTNKEIAELLEISVKTVEAHKANGMRKLNLPARSALVRYGRGIGVAVCRSGALRAQRLRVRRIVTAFKPRFHA